MNKKIIALAAAQIDAAKNDTKWMDPSVPPPEAQQTVVVGDNPILADVAQAHEPLVYVRGAVAQAMLAANMQMRPVLAVSLISVGDRVEDQMLVFSPGGDTARNARTALERMRAATLQLEQLVEAGAFDG